MQSLGRRLPLVTSGVTQSAALARALATDAKRRKTLDHTPALRSSCCAGQHSAPSRGNASLSSEQLDALPNLCVHTPLVTSVLGLNPGKFTLQGTNTYLVGSGKRRILIDTGEGRSGYIDNLTRALAQCGAEGIESVLITHYHHDHTGGISDVLERFGPVPVYQMTRLAQSGPTAATEKAVPAYPGKTPTQGRVQATEATTQDQAEMEPKLGYKTLPLVDGQQFVTQGANLRAMHTPGHTDDHVCFLLEEERAVFSGDCVLGAGTTVFTDLRRYMASLNKLLEYKPNVIYPAHGPLVTTPIERLQAYVSHRLAREAQIVESLSQATAPMASVDLVVALYPGLAEGLIKAAQRSVLLHLTKLRKDGLVACASMQAPNICLTREEFDAADAEQLIWTTSPSTMVSQASHL